jgi:hypothetical protein
MASKKKTEQISAEQLAGVPDEELRQEQPDDGPTRVDPIPPPSAAAEAPKKKRGRPPGVRNGEGTGDRKKRPDPVIELDDVKREMAQLSALAVTFTRDERGAPAGNLGVLADTLEWHKTVNVHDEATQRTVAAIAPSDKLEKAVALMGPYLEKSGALAMVQLGPEAKFAIGLGVLLAPTFLTGFSMLWNWAMHPPKAAAQVVPMASTQQKGAN